MSSTASQPASTGISLVAETRTEFGKGAARRIRRDHKIPAVLYGHGEDPRHITLPGHATMLALKHKNALLSLQVEGGLETLAIAKDVQIDPVRRDIEHVDLVLVRRGERVEVQVPIRLVGDPAGDGVVTLEHPTVTVTAEATALPDVIEVDVEGLHAGTVITAAQLKLPAGTEVVGDLDIPVVSVVGAPSAAAIEADLAEAEAELGIEHDASNAELAEAAEQDAATDAAE